jgi:hypothetical protein
MRRLLAFANLCQGSYYQALLLLPKKDSNCPSSSPWCDSAEPNRSSFFNRRRAHAAAVDHMPANTYEEAFVNVYTLINTKPGGFQIHFRWSVFLTMCLRCLTLVSLLLSLLEIWWSDQITGLQLLYYHFGDLLTVWKLGIRLIIQHCSLTSRASAWVKHKRSLGGYSSKINTSSTTAWLYVENSWALSMMYYRTLVMEVFLSKSHSAGSPEILPFIRETRVDGSNNEHDSDWRRNWIHKYESATRPRWMPITDYVWVTTRKWIGSFPFLR